MRVAKEALSFNDAEHKALEFNQEGEQVQWKDGAVGDRDIKLGEIISQMIKKELKSLDEKEDLTPQQVTLYEKFVEGES